MTGEDRELALVELLGALTYGQLRSFDVTARAIHHAPDVRRADDLADYAVREHVAYVSLRDHLRARTDLAAAVMDRQRPRFDAYFDQAPVRDWLSACTFFAVGLPMAADFTREIAPTLDDETAAVVTAALAERSDLERFAIEEVVSGLRDRPDRLAEVRAMAADVFGRALTEFQGAVAETDALTVLLRDEQQSDDVVRNVAMQVISGHRRRMHALGIDDPA